VLPELQSVRLGETTIAYRTWGDEAAPAVLFWHAIGTVVSGAYAGEIAPILVGHGFRVIALDGPGHGGSPTLAPEDYALPGITDLAASFVYELGLEKLAWVGHSWGAMVGAHFAARFPTLLRALVLLDAGHSDPQDQPCAPQSPD
jgi:pimeloyl-ACP methyl ester carboxylesterase